MICGYFSENAGEKLVLNEVDGILFEKVLDLWCGRNSGLEVEVPELLQLASVADRFQINDVLSLLEEVLLDGLKIGLCGEILTWSGRIGMGRLAEAARRLAAERFEEVVATAGFAQMDEVALGSLLDDDGLEARSEEVVWEALLRWMQEEEGRQRMRELVRKVRFPLMDGEYLRSRVVGMLAAEDDEWIKGVVAEALQAKEVMSGDYIGIKQQQLSPKALIHRAGAGVRWGECAAGGGSILDGHSSPVTAIAECAGRICSGSEDGSIRIWNRTSLEHERTLFDSDAAAASGSDCSICSLAVWEGHLISGHSGGKLRVWNVAKGLLVCVFEGHGRRVSSLAVCRSHVVSGSFDKCIKVWAMADAPMACKRTLTGHTGRVWTLAVWEGKVISGSDDLSIRVWDLGTGTHDATLAGHTDIVTGLAVHGDRFFSGSFDGTIRVWAAGTWAALQVVEAQAPGESRYILHLAITGSRLVSGRAAFGRSQGEVRVWCPDTLECEYALQQPDFTDVTTVVAAGGRVWVGVENTVVVRGQR
jgi:hypothetical protein